MMPMYPADSVSANTTNAIVNDLPQVTGSAEAKSKLTRPSTRDVLWDKEENYFYMRVTDVTGKIISFERYSYDPSPEPRMEDLFVSNEKFNEVTNSLQGGIDDVKQSIQDLISAIGATNNQSNRKPRRDDNGNASGVQEQQRSHGNIKQSREK